MEAVHQGRRIRREMSPERAKMCGQARVMKPTFKKVQVVYYLSTNGHLHHPHYIEVTHLAHQHLRLKDVLDRLKVLRGQGMPSLYSWSCKRSFKNGYVWNDLAQNDVIFPSEGGEYVLKGSELLIDCTEKLHHLQFQHGNSQEPNFYPSKRRISASKQQINGQEMIPDRHVDEENAEQDEEYDDKATHATCSRGVSTDEVEEETKHKHSSQKNSPHTELNLDTNSLSSPPSTTSSTPSDNPNTELAAAGNGSKRFEDGDPIGNEPMLSRNSMLFSLIACGGTGSFRKAVLPPSVALPCTAGRKSCSGGGSSLHKGVVCKAAKMATEEERVMISYMSENPRFGNSQAEEKEYFSGSIVDSITNDCANEPVLKKSSSYNQERCAKAGLGGEEVEEEAKKEKGLRGKCIPRKKKSSSKHPKK